MKERKVLLDEGIKVTVQQLCNQLDMEKCYSIDVWDGSAKYEFNSMAIRGYTKEQIIERLNQFIKANRIKTRLVRNYYKEAVPSGKYYIVINISKIRMY